MPGMMSSKPTFATVTLRPITFPSAADRSASIPTTVLPFGTDELVRRVARVGGHRQRALGLDCRRHQLRDRGDRPRGRRGRRARTAGERGDCTRRGERPSKQIATYHQSFLQIDRARRTRRGPDASIRERALAGLIHVAIGTCAWPAGCMTRRAREQGGLALLRCRFRFACSPGCASAPAPTR